MLNGNIVSGAGALLAIASIHLGTATALAQESDPAPNAPSEAESAAEVVGPAGDAPGSAVASADSQPTPVPVSTPEASGAPEASSPVSQAQTESLAPPPVPTAPASLPNTAHVQVHVDRAGAWLELRDDLAGGPWRRVCDAPCDQIIDVYGTEARINGPTMTPSNRFRIEPGIGAARFKVKAGSATARRWGTILLATGLPLSALGFATYGYGEMVDEAPVAVTGAVVLGVGAGAVVASFVLVSRGGTRVRDARGRRIAAAPARPRF